MKQENKAKKRQRCSLWDIKLARGHTFIYSPGLRGSAVIDGGAHRCEFADIMASTYGARVIGLEPNSELPIDYHHPDIALVRAALSDDDGEGAFFLDENPEGGSIIQGRSKHITEKKAVPVKFRGLASLVEEFGVDKFALLKLDIEGAEFDVIRSIGDDLASMIQQITVEFHPALPQGDDVVRMEAAFAHLAAQGFHMCRSSYRGYGDVLFLNSRYFKEPSKGFRLLLPYFRKGLERGLFG